MSLPSLWACQHASPLARGRLLPALAASHGVAAPRELCLPACLTRGPGEPRTSFLPTLSPVLTQSPCGPSLLSPHKSPVGPTPPHLDSAQALTSTHPLCSEQTPKSQEDALLETGLCPSLQLPNAAGLPALPTSLAHKCAGRPGRLPASATACSSGQAPAGSPPRGYR